MLSYDDSKRLRELGYPQELKRGDWFYAPGDEPGQQILVLCKDKLEAQTLMGYQATYVKVPTTDGMIEGLGLDLYSLMPMRGLNTNGKEVIEYFARPSADRDKGVLKPTADRALCELWKKVKTVPSSE